MMSYLPPSDDVSNFLWHLRDFIPEYHHAKFGCNWTTKKKETDWAQCASPAYMVPKDPSLNRVKTMKAVLFHLDYSGKACQDRATLVTFNNFLKAGSHDPIFGSDFYSSSKTLLT